MEKLIELTKDDSILVSSKIEKYLKPDKVYLPVNQNKILVNPKTLVKIGDEVIENVLSPISGIVQGLKKLTSYDETGYFLEIINNYEERSKNNIGFKNKLTKEKLLKFINLTSKTTLVLNAIDDEVYVLTQNFYLSLYYEELLELLDEINKLIKLEHIYICLKASSSANINKLMSDLGMYPDIELITVPNLYLLGQPTFLLKYLNLEASKTCIINAEDFYDLYNYLKRGRIKSEKLITLSGNALKNPMIVQVKIGTLLKDILNELIIYNCKDVLYFANGIMSGHNISIENFVITNNLSSILIMANYSPKKEGKCLNCGACINICPVHLNPLLFSNEKYLKKAQKECLKCGLCSYICPVYINFNKFLKGDQND